MRITLLVPPVLEGTREVERVFGCTYGLYPIPNIYVLTVAFVWIGRSRSSCRPGGMDVIAEAVLSLLRNPHQTREKGVGKIQTGKLFD